MSLKRIYEVVIDEWGDPRVNNIIGVNTPALAFGSIFCYLYFVRVCGPKFMKNRQPYDLKKWISLYNFLQILFNLTLLCKGIRLVLNSFNIDFWLCVPISSGNDYVDYLMVSGTEIYFYNKIFDCMDTVFFVLRKKYSQVTFLHVYHHATMVFASWIFIKYSPGGNPVSGGIFNALVHTVMYIYYQMSLMKWGNPDSWKKYITQLQIFQLLTVGTHNSLTFFRNPCNNFNILNAIIVFNSFYLANLFIQFYYKAYWKKSKKT